MKIHAQSWNWTLSVFAISVAAVGCGSDTEAVEDSTSSEDEITVGAPLVGAQSGRCLDVTGNSQTPGTGLQIKGCNGQSNQAFTFTAAGELRVFGTARCVAPQNGQAKKGARLVSDSCNGQAAQKWKRN